MSRIVLISRRSYSLFKSIKFDADMQKKLERLSLISFQNKQTLEKVQQTIQSTEIIHQANVKQLQPLYTLVETEICPLRQTDAVSEEKTLTTKQVLQNAANTYEDYLVAPMIGKRDSQTVEKVDKAQL